MKKFLLSIAIAVFTITGISAQTVIFDNGPIFDQPGIGVGGANVSTLHDGLTTYGINISLAADYRCAEDFTIPAGTTWILDSIVVFAYQSFTSTTSTMLSVNMQIWDGPPGDPGSTVVFGDAVTDIMITTEFVGTYRTGDFGGACAPATCSDRPIMRNALLTPTTLSTGTYWIDWQVDGSSTSGPWGPPINLGAGITTTGNAQQYVPANSTWTNAQDGGTLTGMGLPFLVVGTIVTGIDEINSNSNVSIFPNPVKNQATVRLNLQGLSSDLLTLTVYDVLGSRVSEIENISVNEFTFNRNNLPNGLYMYELTQAGNRLSVGKIVLQ